MADSPYIERLRAAIAHAQDPSTAAFHRAEFAACLARHGRFSESEEEIKDLRKDFGDGRSGRVSIMIMCAEAQLIYYRQLGEQARDRMMRAQLLSVAGRDGPLSALTSAWLAHIAFNQHRKDEMVRAARTSLDTVSPEDHEAASRLALTLGDAFYAAEQAEIGNRWYAKAHARALKLGDHSTIGALTYNRAAMGTFMARVAAAAAAPGAEHAKALLGQVRTAINYQAIAQLKSLEPLLDYSLSSAYILGGNYSEAVPLLSKLVSGQQATGVLDRQSVLLCDLAMCLANIGQVAEARRLVLESVPVDKLEGCTSDDRVVAFHSLQQACMASGLDKERETAGESLERAFAEHTQAAAALRSVLAPFADASASSRL